MIENNQEKIMEVRGKVIASIPKFVIKYFGKEGYEKWLDAISAEAHNIYILPIELKGWYPVQVTLIKPCANIAQLFYQWDLKKAAWELGRFSSDFGLKNIKRLFIKLGSTAFFLNKAPDFMNDNYRPAKMEAVEVTDSTAVLRLTEFQDIEKTVEYRIAGWTERTMEINGCKNIKIDITKSKTEFKPYSEFHISWE
jgi:hypothetical protein